MDTPDPSQATPLGMDVLLELTQRYTEPWRHYHTLRHIAEMLHAGADKGLTEVQVAAIWFHDAVYDPRSTTNERDSADLAVTRLQAAGWAEEQVRAVESIVLDTIEHVPTSEAARAVVDLDLASLALPWDAYRSNTERIRTEYEHVPDADFRAGQKAFFQRFLARERLFWTDWGQAFEAPARANLRRTLEA